MFSQIFSFSVLIFWDLDILKFWCFLNLLRFLSLLSFLILVWFWDFPSSAINANRVIPDKVLWVAWEDSSNWVAWAPDLEFIAGHCSLDCTVYTICLLYSVESWSSECKDRNIELWPKICGEWLGCCTEYTPVLNRTGQSGPEWARAGQSGPERGSAGWPGQRITAHTDPWRGDQGSAHCPHWLWLGHSVTRPLTTEGCYISNGSGQCVIVSV